MKKHDEGYALVLVLVVIVVLAMIAAALMGFSLSNLKSQTASIERMVAKYEAEGEIEKVVANLNAVIDNPPEEAKTFQDLLGITCTPSETEEQNELEVSFTVTGQKNKTKAIISCTLLLTAEKVDKLPDSEFKITKLKTVEYSAYDISYEEVPKGGGS